LIPQDAGNTRPPADGRELRDRRKIELFLFGSPNRAAITLCATISALTKRMLRGRRMKIHPFADPVMAEQSPKPRRLAKPEVREIL